MITKGTFQEVAQIVRARIVARPVNESDATFNHGIASMARDLADMFARSNGRFDRGRFYGACGLDATGHAPARISFEEWHAMRQTHEAQIETGAHNVRACEYCALS